MTASARQHSQRNAAFAKVQLPTRHRAITKLQLLRVQRSFLLSASGSKEQRSKRARWGGGRNARATSRACARYLEVRRRFTLENRRLPLSLPQSFGEHRKCSRFAEPTLSQIVAPRNTKKLHPCAEAVEDVTCLWKTEEN